MDEKTCLQLLTPPSKIRPTVRYGGVLQIWVTRACDRACFGCTQGSNLGGVPGRITPEQFEKACQSLVDYFGVVGVFGGNPTLHPQFDLLCEILRKYIPFERRGLWSNKLFGHGKVCRETFNPAVSNLNVHLDREAYEEFRRDWPEARPFGLHEDSRHSPPYVAMQDLIPDEGKRWELIANCDINRYWSAMICVFRGELRGFFCEIAGAQAMLHQHEPDYPDTGLPIEPGWWKRPMADFAQQVRVHCHACGVPLRGYGELACAEDGVEYVTKTHASVYIPKRRGRKVKLVTDLSEIRPDGVQRFTAYLENAKK